MAGRHVAGGVANAAYLAISCERDGRPCYTPALTARTGKSSVGNGHGASVGRCEPRGPDGANVASEP